jgi:hypothetical protein
MTSVMNRLLFRKRSCLAPLLLMAFFAGTATARPANDDGSGFLLRVHREGGFFPNPAYTLTIFADGRVGYLGIANVHRKGKRSSRISRKDIQKLSDQIITADFFDLPGSYDNAPCQEHDQPSSTLEVQLAGRKKDVGTCGAPEAVGEIIAAAERTAHVTSWTFFDPRVLQFDISHGWRVAEHMPKFMEEAIAWHDCEIIDVLVKNGADVNGLNGDHEHFLMGAVRSGDVQAARTLLEVGADWKIEENYGEESPAINAGYRTPDMVKLFLDKGADINALSSGGYTMLMNAASQTNPATVKFLLAHGADVNIRNSRGETSLSRAQEYNRKYWRGSPTSTRASQEIIDSLIAHGAQAPE